MKTYNRRQTLQMVGRALMATALLPGYWLAVNAASYGPAANRNKRFLQLSSILTGWKIDQLDRRLSLEYIRRLDQQSPGALNRLLAQFRELQATAAGRRTRLISLVDQEIWRPQHCAQLCGVDKTADKAMACCLARDLLLLWYAGFLVEKSSDIVPPTQFVYGSAASYRGALAWKLAGTLPPATGGGGYAYWAEKPQ